MATDMALQVIVSPFLGRLFDNLGSLIRNEAALIWGVDKEMKKLASTLSTIRDVLEDAEEKQITDKAVANWLRKLRDLAFDADDILDQWETEARELQMGTENIISSKQACPRYFSCFNFAQLAFHHKIAKRVNNLREKFNDIFLEKSSFGLRVGVVERSLGYYRNRETSSLPTDPCVFGRDEERDFIVRMILNNFPSEVVSVHPIVGIGGLGKTTLAQVCYNDQRVLEHFDVRIWVCVSDDFDVKRLTKAVIISTGGDVKNIEDLDPLQRLLEIKLVQKRFLLVLDDVWNENQEEWSRFKNSLRCGAIGSSIIVTTRLKTVASITGTHDPLFLKLLSEDDCWSLFRVRAFGMGNGEYPSLQKIGHEIVKNCRGVPLVAKVLGGLLRFKHDEKEWANVRDTNIWELPQTDGNTILPALRLSYTHLAPHLRQCFAYCSVFPKGTRMRKDDLIRLWMANGFFQSKGEMQMEDIGNEIFNELSWRSFFQNERKNSDGLVDSCTMHDLIHDLACSVNMNECGHLAEGTQASNIHPRTRHLCINRAIEGLAVTDSIYRLAPNLRTLMLLKYDCDNEHVAEVCLTSIRAFILREAKVFCPIYRKLLDSLGKMKHLRYLDISYSEVRMLPESLCGLRNLQTLGLERCYKLEELPKHMGIMSSLRHLNIEECSKLSEMPVGMGKLICLHTLTFFIVGSGNGRRIKELRALDCLGGQFEIKGLEHVKTREEAKEADLMKKQNIVSLKLNWNVDPNGENCHKDVLEGLQPHPNMKRLVVNGYRGLTFPSWLDLDVLSSIPNLVDISISSCSGCEHIPSSLGMLPLLRRLEMSNVDPCKFFLANGYHDAFPSLEDLYIFDMEELEDWFPYGTESSNPNQVILFPRLQTLVLQNSPKMKRIPPSSLSYLEYLSVSYCNQMIFRSVQNLPRLSSLHIADFNDITCFPEGSLPDIPSLKSLDIQRCSSLQSMPSLMGIRSLTRLYIENCPSLTNVSQALRCLTTLQSLRITSCPKAEISTVEYENLNFLQSIYIGGFDNLTTLPDGLHHLSSTLQSLEIYGWSALNSLPDWLVSFTNLKTLRIQGCRNLRSLPDGVRQLSSLQFSEI